MPPSLALFLGTLYVLFLLRLDRKEASTVSLLSWIPTLWILIISSKGVGTWFGVEAEEDGSLWDRVVLSGMICTGVFMLVARKVKVMNAIRENVWLFILIAYMLVSILWSDIPYISFKRWVREFGSVVMALVLLTEPDPRLAVESVLRRSAYILVPMSLILIKYYPHYGVDYGKWFGDISWIGVCVVKNGLGRLCLISSFFIIWTLIVRWWRGKSPRNRFQTAADVSVLLIALFLLKGPPGAYPATAIGALLIGCGGFMALLMMEKWRIHVGVNLVTVMLAGLIVLGTVTPFVGGATVGGLSSVFGRNENLTGRTDIWARLLPLYEKSPFEGYGFGSFWTPAMENAIYGVREAHNGYLEVCLGIGLIGLVLTAMFLLSFSRRAQKSLARDYDWGGLCLCFLVIALLHNITESSIDSFGRQLMAVLLFLSVCLPKHQKLDWYRSLQGAAATSGNGPSMRSAPV
jgi:O-antigen ligase